MTDDQATHSAAHRRSRFLASPLLWGFVLFLGVWLVLAVPVPAGEKKYSVELKPDPEHPWTLKADEVIYDGKTREYKASGHVIIQQLGKTIQADHVIFNAQTLKALAKGHVKLTLAGDILTAEAMELNLGDEKGVLTESRIFLEESHLYIKGKRIEKSDAYTYVAENAEVTSCDGEDPDWRVTGKKVEVTLDEYAWVKHGRLWAGDLPVFYTPFFLFPVKLQRQTGLLIPNLGFSNRKGFEWDQPLFWAINDYSDATLFTHALSQRGYKTGLEYRFVEDPDSRMTVQADFLEDREVDDGQPRNAGNWGYSHDIYPRPNEDRYWVRMKLDHDLPAGFTGKLDLDWVSDQDYLIEFRDGYSSYNESREAFKKDFSRILDAYEDPVRTNRLNLNKKGAMYSWNNSLTWYDNVNARRYLDENHTLQNLPRIQFDMLKQPIEPLPLYYSLGSDYTYFYSRDGAVGHRMDLHPGLYVPIFTSPFANLESFIGGRETLWRMNRFESDPGESGKEQTSYRHLYDFRLNLRSEAFRVYEPANSRFSRIKHVISPEIVYTFIPHGDQGEYPSMDHLADGINRIEKTNQLSFFLTQYLTTRQSPVPPVDSAPPREKAPKPMYHQMMRFSLEQSLDINEARANNPLEYRNQKSKQPILPLTADLEWFPRERLSLWSQTRWSYYENKLVENNVELGLESSREDRLALFYHFTEDALETLGAGTLLRVYGGFSVFGNVEYNLRNHENIENGAGFDYDTQCWSFRLKYSDKEDDRKVEFFINLKGLG